MVNKFFITKIPGLSVFCCLLLLILLSLGSKSHAADIKVSLDREVVSLDDSFTITYQVTGAVDEEPDFSPLEKNFSILNKQRRSNITIINGQRSSNVEWIVEAIARRVGDLTIPSIPFGKQLSPSRKLSVRKTPAASKVRDDFFVEVEAKPESAWVQGQIIFTIRLFRAEDTFNSSLSEPEISGGQVLVEKLEDRQFQTSRNNRRYAVIERRYALFPQSSGTLTINPIVFTGYVSKRSRNLFDPFALNSQTVRRHSEAVSIKVKPASKDFTGSTWLPAKNLELDEKWLNSKLEMKVGQPITRTIVIKAKGLMAEQLPELSLTEAPNFKVYPDQPELNNQTSNEGILGIRQEKSALIPSEAGEYVLPAFKLSWWNTETGKTEIAELPQRVISVLPADNQTPQVDDDSDNPPQPIDPTLKDPILTSDRQTLRQFWPFLSLILGAGWLLTLILWWRQKHRNTKHHAEDESSMVSRSTVGNLKLLRKAVRTNDPAQVKNALLEWAAGVWQDKPPKNLFELGMRTDQSLAIEIARLDQVLYGKADNDDQWDAERLLLSVENYDGLRQEDRLKKKHSKPELESMYKISSG